MKYGPLLGWGVAIYSSMFLMWTGFLTYGFVVGYAPRIVATFALVFVALLAGRSLRLHSWLDILPYSIAWSVMMIIMDIIFSVPLAGWGIFANPNAWFGYAMVALVPLAAPYARFDRWFISDPEV